MLMSTRAGSRKVLEDVAKGDSVQCLRAKLRSKVECLDVGFDHAPAVRARRLGVRVIDLDADHAAATLHHPRGQIARIQPASSTSLPAGM